MKDSLPIEIDLSRIEDVPFEDKKEIWNEYLLSDESKIRLKVVVTKFLKTPEIDPLTNCPQYIIASKNIVSVTSSKRGKPTPPQDLKEIPDEKKVEVEVSEIVKEDWNEYIIEDKYICRLKPVIVLVYKIKDSFDVMGYPIYFVRSQNIVKINMKK